MTSLIEQQQSLIKPHTGFTLDYLDYNQREKIVKHRKAGKTLKCHNKNCDSFNGEFSGLYEYNIHCHTTHKKQPLHPELSLIELLKLEPRGNPWEDDSCSVSIIETKDKKSKNHKEEIEKGLDFLLSHFNQERLFPRKIQTRKSEGKQIEVFSREETLQYFEESDYLDCRINSFPSYTEYKGIQRYPPDFIFIDLDQNSFKTDKSFKLVLSKTLKNIKEKLGYNVYPTVNWSGNGYHIILPIECPILEQIEQFQKYKDIFFLSQEFLRFAEYNLSNRKSDIGHHPSFKSCQIRVPGSVNGKCLDNRDKRLSGDLRIKTLYRWNGIRPLITTEFLEDFRTYLEQKITDQENNNYNYNYKKNNNNQNHYNNDNHIEWIETKVLSNPFSDYRKLAVGLILAPYLIVIKKLSYEESYKIINKWLMKCDSVKKLDFDPRYLINNNIKTSAKKLIPPISLYKLETNYPNLYFLINQKKRQERKDSWKFFAISN